MRSVQEKTALRSKPIPRLALVLIGAALLAISLSPAGATADGGHGRGEAENTFTKWANNLPQMAGIVGGDVGAGTFTGEVLSAVQVGNVATMHAVYRFHGSRESFTANVVVVQTDLKAVITGFVTDGWLKGNLVQGKYRQITCSHDGISTPCFRGTLDILRNHRDRDD